MFVAIVIVGVLIATGCAAMLARPPKPKGGGVPDHETTSADEAASH